MSDRLPSASGARISGDDYQHAVTWLEALLLLVGNDVTRIEFEVGDAAAGIVDDLSIHRTSGRPSLYKQIKFGVDDGQPLTSDWFTAAPGASSTTPLQRFYDSFMKLSADAEPLPELELLTARQIAPDDPLLKHRSNRDGTLTARSAAWSGEAKNVLESWRAHLDVEEDEFEEFLEHLKISSGRGSLEQLFDHCGERMRAAGLKDDPGAVLVGIGIVRTLIGEGTRSLDADAMRALIEEHAIETEPARATLLVQELDHRAYPQLATASVDWVDDFIGNGPNDRRRPTNDSCWDDVFLPDLQRAVQEIRDLGYELVLIDGGFRLSTAFAVGRELNERSNVDVIIPQRRDCWSSAETVPEGGAALQTEVIEIDESAGIAVAVSISADIARDVEAYLQEIPGLAGRILVIRPESGPDRRSVTNAGEALVMADQIVDAVRAAASNHDAKVHLFLACPGPLAMFLGRVWNRTPPGWVYADLNPGYVQSYRI